MTAVAKMNKRSPKRFPRKFQRNTKNSFFGFPSSRGIAADFPRMNELMDVIEHFPEIQPAPLPAAQNALVIVICCLVWA
jgi:hypothetical protein